MSQHLVIGTGPVINVKPPTICQKSKIRHCRTKVDVEANFEGGIDAFRNKVMNKFDGSGFENEGSIKTTITFIVEMDGTISGIKAMEPMPILTMRH
jgi:protein TonB